MNDEGIGIAGWLLADLMIVLVAVFLALAPGRDAPPIEEPVTATPVATPTSVPTPTVTPTPTATAAAIDNCLLRTDGFLFSQIVLFDVSPGKISWEKISGSRVRENLKKSQEDDPIRREDDPTVTWSPDPAGQFLKNQQERNFRIALIETFAHQRGDTPGADVALAKKVNEAFIAGLEANAPQAPNGDIFLDSRPINDWIANYLDTRFPELMVRINLYFVQVPDESCR